MNDNMVKTQERFKNQYQNLTSGTEAIVREHQNMPEIPGVYRMLNKHGDVLYVGKKRY